MLVRLLYLRRYMDGYATGIVLQLLWPMVAKYNLISRVFGAWLPLFPSVSTRYKGGFVCDNAQASNPNSSQIAVSSCVSYCFL